MFDVQQKHHRENLRLGLLFCTGFALAFGVAAIVMGERLDHIDLFSSGVTGAEEHERIVRGNPRFARVQLLWRMAMGLLSLCCAALAFRCWRALRKYQHAANSARER